jgi:hypothetical protein
LVKKKLPKNSRYDLDLPDIQLAIDYRCITPDTQETSRKQYTYTL